MMVNVSFDVHGDHAHGTCNLIYFHIKGGKTELTAVGGYRDELRKVNGDWQFAHRQVLRRQISRSVRQITWLDSTDRCRR